MHGHIGRLGRNIHTRGDLDFYYRTRAALLDARRGLGEGTIDYDFYRARAREERRRAIARAAKRLGRLVRPLIALAALAACIWAMPTSGGECRICAAPAGALQHNDRR